jgi:hypothetical protein
MRGRVAIGALVLFACRDPAYIDLQIAKDRLPFPQPNKDFDMLGVEARAMSCANTVVTYPPMVLPATLTVMPGDCFKAEFQLQAFALLSSTRVAESKWLDLHFPGSGVLVVTATLTDLVMPKARFHTGFEPGDPIGATDGVVHILQAAEIPNLAVRIDDGVAFVGNRSVVLSGTASSTGAYGLALVAVPDLLVMQGEILTYAMRIDRAATGAATLGVDVTLDDGRTAMTLSLVDMNRARIDPAAPKSAALGSWVQYTVDLGPAVGARIQDFIFGFDAREKGKAGPFEAHLDEVTIEVP